MKLSQEEINENNNLKTTCILNFGDEFNLDSPVYRIFPINRLVELFNEKQNTLVKPLMWDDPFENLIFKQSAVLQNGVKVRFDSIREKFYGQCWTLNTEETDALWRIYSPNKDGVRVKTTLKKLFNNFYDPNNKFALISFFIGKIKYHTSKQIQTYFEDSNNFQNIFSSSNTETIQTLMLKRTEFKHENEVRLIYSANSETEDTSINIFKYKFEPNYMIDELLFDPRFDERIFADMKSEFYEKGYTKIIEKSKLYEFPKFNLRFVY